MWFEPVFKAVKAASFLLAHTILAAILIICIFGIEKLIGFLWAVETPLLFGRVPLAYMFHAIDFGVLVVFGWRGIQAADKAFRDD